METQVAEEQKLKTCLITLVTPGSSDRVIKVYPAQREKEKIWLDKRPGLERWDAVKRLLNQYAPRGTAIPEPKPWHSDPKQLRAPDLDPSEIPLVKLDGAILEAPIEEEKPKRVTAPDYKAQAQEAKIEKLEAQVGQLVSAVNALLSKNASPDMNVMVILCDVCQKQFKSSTALAMHKGRFHKEGKAKP